MQTGLGKLAAAAATGAMLEAYPDTQAVINVGLCGADEPIGAVFIAQSVCDAASHRCWYPHLPDTGRNHLAEGRDLLSVDAMATTYRAGTLFDMEGSGVAAAALQHLDTARVQFVKCVSDNPAQPADGFDRQQAKALIERTLPVIDRLMQYLDHLPRTRAYSTTEAGIDALTDTLTRRVHHSVTERHALRRLVNRHLALTEALPDEDQLNGYPSATALQQRMHELLSEAGVRY